MHLLLAQILLAQNAGAQLAQQLDAKDQPKISCSITAVPPRLGFSMMHWAGFALMIPIKQFSGAGADLGIAAEVTPDGGKPVYLGERIQVPPETGEQRYPKDAQVQYMGGYFLGPGRYRVRTIAFSSGGRCRKDWSVHIRAGSEPLTLEPNQITPVGGQRWKGLATTEPRRRVTIIIEAAPLFPRRNMVRVSSYDRGVLLTALTTILDKTGFTDATVVAADSRNRKIVFSAADFNPRELRRLGRAVGDINLGVVSMKTLQSGGPEKFFESVLASVDDAVRRSDAVVFLGPAWSWPGKLTPRMREIASAYPASHYVALSRFVAVEDNLPARFVKAGNGSSRQVFTAADLAKAIERISQAKPRDQAQR
ncbi:MAG: hypothetical protein U0Q16_24535 [Bryobacteraceae bacterium]